MTTFAVPVPGRRQAKLINTFEALATWATDIDRFNVDVSESFRGMGRAVTLLTTHSTPSVGAVPPHAVTHAPGGSDAILTGSPVPVGITNLPGTGLALIRNDHVHQGLHSLDAGGADLYGDVTLAASGTGLTVGQVGQTITYTFQGVSSVDAGGADLFGDVTFAASGGLTVNQVGQTITYSLSGGSGSGLDADTLDGLDSTDFIKKDGSIALTADWNAGLSTWDIQALVFKTEPWVVASGTGGRVYLSTGFGGHDIAVACAYNVSSPWLYFICDNAGNRTEAYMGSAGYAGGIKAFQLSSNSGIPAEFALDAGVGRFSAEHLRIGPYTSGNHNAQITLSPRGTGTATLTFNPTTAGYSTISLPNESLRITSTVAAASGRALVQIYGDQITITRNLLEIAHTNAAAAGTPFAVSPYGITGAPIAATTGTYVVFPAVGAVVAADLSVTGTYTALTFRGFRVKISNSISVPQKYRWTNRWPTSNPADFSAEVNVTTDTITDGITIHFVRTTGYAVNDAFDFFAKPAHHRTAVDAHVDPAMFQTQTGGTNSHALIWDTTGPFLGTQYPYLFLVNGQAVAQLGGSTTLLSPLAVFTQDGTDPVITWNDGSDTLGNLTYTSATNLFTASGDLTVQGTTLTVGNSGAVDLVLSFKGGTNDGTITWGDSTAGFTIPHFLTIGGAGVLAPYANNAVLNTFTARTFYNEDSTALGAWAINYADDAVTTYTSYGIQGQSAWIIQNAKGDAYGCTFATQIVGISNKGDGSNSLIGAKFQVSSSGTTDGNNIGALIGGWFATPLGGDSNQYHGVTGMLLDVQVTGTNNTVDTMYALQLAAFNNAGSGNVIDTAYGIFICDVTNMEATPVSGVLDAFHIDVQDGVASDASRGNLRFAGGNYNTGHLQLENGHIWNDATNNALTFKGSAPSSETDGVGITGATITPGTTVGLLTNGPWITGPKDPDAWVELYIGGVRYAIPAWNGS